MLYKHVHEGMLLKVIGSVDPNPCAVVRKHGGFVTALGNGGIRYTLSEATGQLRAYEPASEVRVPTLCAYRYDGWWHYAAIFGRKVTIDAGCQTFITLGQARKHWTKRRRNFTAYKGSSRKVRVGPSGKLVPFHTTKQAAWYRKRDKKLNKWSLAFVRKVERMLAKSR